MRYYLDTEFNGFGGELISLALVREDAVEMYLATETVYVWHEWVEKNVIPFIDLAWAHPYYAPVGMFGEAIANFLHGDEAPTIIADWPDDIRYFCQCLITGPGQMVAIPQIDFWLQRVDSYPTTLPGAVQHNALWDARALRHRLEP